MISARPSQEVFAAKSAPLAIFGFRLSEGQRTPVDLADLDRMVWRFDGSISWRKGRTRVTLSAVRLDVQRRVLTARVAGQRMTIARLDREWLSSEARNGYWPQSAAGALRTSKRFRAVMRSRLRRAPARTMRGGVRIVLPLPPLPDDTPGGARPPAEQP